MDDGYTISSAAYATEDQSAVIAMTSGNGAVIISEKDRPALWARLLKSGVAIAPYQPPAYTQSPADSNQDGPDVIA